MLATLGYVSCIFLGVGIFVKLAERWWPNGELAAMLVAQAIASALIFLVSLAG